MNRALRAQMLVSLRAWVSCDWWLAVASLVAATAAGLGGVLVLVLLVLAVCTLPLALTGVLVFAFTLAVIGWLDRSVRAGVQFTSGAAIDSYSASGFPHSWRALTAAVRSGTTWRSIGYWLVRIPVSVALAFVLPAFFVVLPSVAVAPVVWAVVDPGENGMEIAQRVGFVPVLSAGVIALVVFAFGSPPVMTALARADWWSARVLLGQSESSRRVDELTVSRARVVDAADSERRRIERDLHDGAQQRLVSVALSLGQAKSRAALTGDEVLADLIEDAHREAKNAIGEIRTLTRGLHPPILTDRGLDAALSSVAALCAVPVDIVVDPGLLGEGRLDATRESTLYFVVSEALTNVSKHSGASRVEVSVRTTADSVVVVVLDDGCGGAEIVPRGGLAGLADRLSGADGTVALDSPAGGPTRVEVSLPCA